MPPCCAGLRQSCPAGAARAQAAAAAAAPPVRLEPTARQAHSLGELEVEILAGARPPHGSRAAPGETQCRGAADAPGRHKIVRPRRRRASAGEACDPETVDKPAEADKLAAADRPVEADRIAPEPGCPSLPGRATTSRWHRLCGRSFPLPLTRTPKSVTRSRP